MDARKRLFTALFRGYNVQVLPRRQSNDSVIVNVELHFDRLFDVVRPSVRPSVVCYIMSRTDDYCVINPVCCFAAVFPVLKYSVKTSINFTDSL